MLAVYSHLNCVLRVNQVHIISRQAACLRRLAVKKININDSYGDKKTGGRWSKNRPAYSNSKKIDDLAAFRFEK